MRQLNTRLTALLTAVLTLSAFTFTACHRDKNTTADTEDTGYGADHASLEKTFSDVQSIADEAGTTGSLSAFRGTNNSILSGCANVTIDSTVTPHVLTIDFGLANCLGQDGIYRRGKILVSYSGRYRDMGHTHTITFSNYFVNDNQVTGTKIVTYNANNAQGQPVYDISINGGIVLANNAGTISWTSTRQRTWVAGYNTATWTDDEYEISGTGSVTRANGKTFTVATVTPLHVALNCRWVESGTVTIIPPNAAARTLDYGNGTCDALATYTANGRTYNITLR